MKSEGALRMRFMRHGGIYRSDVSFHLICNLGYFSVGSGPAIERAFEETRSIHRPR